MALSSIRTKYIYMIALTAAIIFTIAFNILNLQSTHTHIIDNLALQYSPNQYQYTTTTNLTSHHPHTNNNITHTKHILSQINTKLKQSNNVTDNILFCDQYKFDLMVSYYKSMNSIAYPNSWIELNDQLFCPIKYTSLYNAPDQISLAGERVLKYIYANQYKKDCNDPNHKFLFYDTTGWFSGLGATTNGGIIKYFTRALMSNRTFVMVGDWDWANTKHCNELINQGLDRVGFRCYFLPNSNCRHDDIIKNMDISNSSLYLNQTGLPKHCSVGDFPDRPWCTERVLYLRNTGAGWYPKNSEIDVWINKVAINSHSSNKHLLFANYQSYRAVIVAFAYRLQPNVRELIYNKIRNAFVKSFANLQSLSNTYDPYKTIGFPIRASDKCADNTMGLHGELECWTTDEINKILYAIHYLKPNINSVIFTSEDAHFVDGLIAYMKATEEGLYTDGFRWNIIINHEDTKPAIGDARFRIKKIADRGNLTVDETSDTDFEHDVIVGALSSLLLQTSNSKYIVHTKSSSWLDNLWNIGAQLNCESIFWSEQLEIKGFGGGGDGEYEEMDVPAFLHSSNKRYHYFPKLCFELKQQGLLNKKTKWKHVLFPPDMWEQIHVLGLNEKRFRQKFGFDILEHGWERFCDRYTKPPFELNDDLGV